MSFRTVLRNIATILAGLVVGSCVNMVFVLLNVEYLYPMPDHATLETTEKFAAYVSGLPWSAFLVVFVAHFGQTLAGSFVAAKLGSRPVLDALLIGLLTMVGCIMNNLKIPVPLWTWIEVPFHPVVAYWVGRYVEKEQHSKKASPKEE